MSTGDLYIVGGEGDVRLYRLRGSNLIPSARADFPGLVFDACNLGSRLFIHGLLQDRDEVIHEVDSSGTVVNSFGLPYRSSTEVVHRKLNSGRLSCLGGPQVVVLGVHNLAEVFGFTPRGDLVWATILSGVPTGLALELGDGTLRTGPVGDSLGLLWSVVGWGEDMVLVQSLSHAREDIRRGYRRGRVDTYLIGAGTGTGGFLSDEIGVLISETPDGVLAFSEWRGGKVLRLRSKLTDSTPPTFGSG